MSGFQIALYWVEDELFLSAGSEASNDTFGYKTVKKADIRAAHLTYTPGDRLLTKQKPDGTVLLHEYDSQKRLKKVGAREFRYDKLDRIIGGTGFSRKLDAFGNIKREEWSNGLWIESDYDDWDRPILRRLPDQSRIEYECAILILPIMVALETIPILINTNIYQIQQEELRKEEIQNH